MEQRNECELPKTGLAIRDGSLVKASATGQVIARHVLADIQRAELARTWDTTGFVLVPTFTALAVVAWAYIPWAGWRWATAIVLWALAGVFVSCIRDLKLRVQTRHGQIDYAIKDEADEAEGFAATLSGLLEQRASITTGDPDRQCL